MSSAQLPLLHQRESRGLGRRRIRAVRAAGTGPTPRLLPLLTHSGAASAAEGRVPGEHGPPARLSCRGWRAVLPLLGTVSTPAQPQVTTRLAPGPVGGVCDRPPHEEVDLTSFPHPAGGQQGGLSNLVGQETGQELKLEEPDLAQPGVDRAEGAWPGQGRRAGQRACPGQRAWPGGGAWPGQGRRGGAKETLLPHGGLCSAFWTPKCPHIMETLSPGTLACGGRGEPC